MYKKLLSDWFESHMDEILNSLNEIVSIESIADDKSEIKPFGADSAKALKWGADFMKKIGMTVENCDNYAVHGDFFPQGKPELAVLSHLDVVPAGGGWSYPPFALTEKEGVLYGRGVIDDKGPSVAVLYACKAIRELGIPVKKNFRVIFGGNEEGGCQDMEYYSQKYPFPEKVFTPDGSFPVLNCEKGMVHLNFEGKYIHGEKFIKKLRAGTVINAVPDKLECLLAGVTAEEIYKGFNRLDGLAADCRETEEGLNCIVYGKSAHGSRPERGKNVITALLKVLEELGFKGLDLGIIFPHDEFNGKSAGMGYSDRISGEMTAVLTLLDCGGENFRGGIDIRFPINKTLAQITDNITSALKRAGMSVGSIEGMEPHYVPEESEFVQTLLKVYENVKGEKGYCIAEGGITYVHNTKGGVAFGAEFPDEDNNMHGADEHISIETFKMNLNMYANAIIACTL